MMKLHIRKLKKTEPFEKLKQMSLPSLALNLFDRSGEMKVSMDMLALKIQEIYHMENLIITRFYRDTLVNLYGYNWKEKDNSWDGILRCTGSDYKRYVETKIVQKLMPVTKREQNDVTICRFLPSKDSWIFHMADEGCYSGSIIFVGIDNEIMKEGHNQKRLEEVCTIIQNRMNLESELHKGSNFSFTLKLKYLENVEEVKDSSEKSLDLKEKHILIVEDNELNMEIIHTILDKYEAKIEEAYDGQQALEKIRQSKEGEYDLILMDIMMPVMDGLEAAREIRKLPRNDCKTLPIVAMSANAFDEDVKKSLASGMDAHLSKPINMEQLEKTLARFVKGPC